MTVAKLSHSGKQVQVVTDDGWVFVIAKSPMQKLLDGKIPGFLTLTRLSVPVSPDRFPKSPIWNPNGVVLDIFDDKVLDVRSDMFTKTATEKARLLKPINDVMDW